MIKVVILLVASVLIFVIGMFVLIKQPRTLNTSKIFDISKSIKKKTPSPTPQETTVPSQPEYFEALPIATENAQITTSSASQ